MSWKRVQLSEVLIQQKETVELMSNEEYTLVTISKTGAITKRETKKGVEIKGKSAIKIKSGDFIYSRLAVHSGAFGIIPKELNDAIVTNEMPSFEIKDNILPEFLIHSLTLPDFIYQITHLTKGVGRTRVKEKSFLGLEINLPTLSQQKQIVTWLASFSNNSDDISANQIAQLDLVKQLRQAFLREAMQGKLVPQDEKDESASVLLEKIKAEKEQLIKEKKIKKEKPLPPISEEEIPFEIPENWVWCRLNEICLAIIDCPHSTPKYIETETEYYGIDTNCINDKGEIVRLRGLSYQSYLDRVKRLIPKENDIVYAREGSIGRATFVPSNQNVCLGQRVMLFRPALAISHLYLMYAVTEEGYKQRLLSKHRGMGAKHVNVGDIVESLIALPPLSEQQRIVAKLVELMKLCDNLEVSIKASQQQNELLLQQVLREALEPRN